NVSLAKVEDAKLGMAKSKQSIRVSFVFETRYEPSVAKLHFEGDVILLEDKKRGAEILNHWKKENALPKELMQGLLNNVLDRCNVQALILARDLSLPAPVPLPKVNLKEPAKKSSKKTV
ncbi:hypothetical protein D6789_01385, partial [Candidatus Woesearchaeota archaeon]